MARINAVGAAKAAGEEIFFRRRATPADGKIPQNPLLPLHGTLDKTDSLQN